MASNEKIMNDDLEMVCNEKILVYFKIPYDSFMNEIGKTMKTVCEWVFRTRFESETSRIRSTKHSTVTYLT
jgi:hypothetical protein